MVWFKERRLKMLKPISIKEKRVCIGAMGQIKKVQMLPRENLVNTTGEKFASLFVIPDRSDENYDFGISDMLNQDFNDLMVALGNFSFNPSKIYIWVHKLELLSQMTSLGEFLIDQGFKDQKDLEILVFLNDSQEIAELDYLIESQCRIKKIPADLIKNIKPSELLEVIFQS